MKRSNKSLDYYASKSNFNSGHSPMALDYDDASGEGSTVRLFSDELRELVIELIGREKAELLACSANGHSNAAVAEMFKIHCHTVRNRVRSFNKLLKDSYLMKVATVGHSELLLSNGGTISPFKLKPVEGPFYAWSLRGYERTYRGFPTVEQVLAYVTMVHPVLFVRRRAQRLSASLNWSLHRALMSGHVRTCSTPFGITELVTRSTRFGNQ